MMETRSTSQVKVPRLQRLVRLPQQQLAINPFDGDSKPSRVPLFLSGSGRPTVPFPHPWNYEQPITILETYIWGAEREQGPGRHNRYLDFPGFPAVLVTRDPGMIRAILTATGDGEGQFDRDTLPSTGIARATGKDTLLFANGPFWRRQRKVAASPFGFGHGSRVCPGKQLGQLEVGLVVGAFVKLFRFRAVNQENVAKAGVSTKPLDGTLVDLELR